jgi:alkylhydroperoxidase/carboxymuconolactone decarboxylase family protein
MGEDVPALWDKFMAYYGSVFEDGALTAREKALIAFGVAHVVQCPYCIDSYTQTLLQMGVNQEQMIEAIHAAAALRGGATLAHGMQGACQIFCVNEPPEILTSILPSFSHRGKVS